MKSYLSIKDSVSDRAEFKLKFNHYSKQPQIRSSICKRTSSLSSWMVYLSSDHFSSLPPLSPISSYFHIHEDDCSILLIGLVSFTCTPVVHCPQRSLSNPYKALSLLSSKPCNGSISLRSKSKVFTMVHEAHML